MYVFPMRLWLLYHSKQERAKLCPDDKILKFSETEPLSSKVSFVCKSPVSWNKVFQICLIKSMSEREQYNHLDHQPY